MNLTFKQKSILRLIRDANPGGEPIDFDQLLERLPYSTTKDSMHFSLRALIAKGLAEKGALENRRLRSRRLILITPLGEHWATLLCPPLAPAAAVMKSALESGDVDDLLDEALSSSATHSI